MGKKKEQSLTERLAALISRVGEKPEPTFAYIKGVLVDCRTLAESLEEGAVIRDAEAKITVLEKALEDSNTEKGQLQTELQSVRTEVEGFRVAREKQQEEERKKDIPPEQLEVLRRLPSKHGGKGLTIAQIWRETNFRLDETEIHVDKLGQAGLIEWHDSDGEQFWRRTMLGNELIVARRLAGKEEEEEEEWEQELPQLTRMEQLVLLAVAEGNRVPEKIVKYIEKAMPTVGPPITNEGAVLLLLVTLRGKKVVTDKRTGGAPYGWKVSRVGREYLADLENFS